MVTGTGRPRNPARPFKPKRFHLRRSPFLRIMAHSRLPWPRRRTPGRVHLFVLSCARQSPTRLARSAIESNLGTAGKPPTYSRRSAPPKAIMPLTNTGSSTTATASPVATDSRPKSTPTAVGIRPPRRSPLLSTEFLTGAVGRSDSFPYGCQAMADAAMRLRVSLVLLLALGGSLAAPSTSIATGQSSVTLRKVSMQRKDVRPGDAFLLRVGVANRGRRGTRVSVVVRLRRSRSPRRRPLVAFERAFLKGVARPCS